ncbi:hypothetical protein [Sinorhizobium saheli]|uniref:Uncharacterized protein n=1 Tax=Sinorhizobium saheli TaxID=36856 RepID=A0A178Y6F8_SINSA|nr:hypothetical protein [Sinorhizobium saheli]MQW87818.1 hypothetical protein [Sinorhizobium saheli]OAP43027.1 hypothetical protein ATB98_15360 [Sinorhizobium saheli]
MAYESRTDVAVDAAALTLIRVVDAGRRNFMAIFRNAAGPSLHLLKRVTRRHSLRARYPERLVPDNLAFRAAA